jgi:hypothetical protein
MKTKLFLFILLLFPASNGYAQVRFADWFEEKSLRIDFALSGNNRCQQAALQQMREEPVWGGPVKNLIDTFYYGDYYVNLYDKAGRQLIYSRGFNTLFEEWRLTEQAKSETQSWTNSVSVPFPKKETVVEITGRDRSDRQFHTLLTVDVDPSSLFIDRGKLNENPVTLLQYKGGPASKIDLVFIAEGYTAEEKEKFEADARRFTESLFQTPPFDTRRDDFNVRAVALASEESGTDIAGEGIFKNTALNAGFYTFGIDRYLTTPDMKSIRDAVWNLPCDAIFILVNTDRYGGGGMYNFYGMGTSDNAHTPAVFAHEFGHSFAGLADEYFSSEATCDEPFYTLDKEPWEPNITIYRPMDHCMMRDLAPFCPVCSRAILRMIDFLSDREAY